MSSQLRILIIDDNQPMAFAMQRVLSKAGYQAVYALTKKEGLQLFAEQYPDIVLIDRVLPDGDGLEICQYIKNNPETRQVMVILISGLKMSEDEKIEGLDSGADAYLTRPISNRQLVAQVAALNRIKTSELRVAHLHQALRAITDVNQLIAREKDHDRMLQGTCDLLVHQHGYTHVWLFLVNSANELAMSFQSNRHNTAVCRSLLQEGDPLPACAQEALTQPGVRVSHDSGFCPMVVPAEGLSLITTRLKFRDEVYGLICAQLPDDMADDQEEHFLFMEVAEDIAFALFEHEMQAQHQKDDLALTESQRQLAALLRNLPGMAYQWVYENEIVPKFVSEGCLALTGYDSQALFEQKAISFSRLIHPDDRARVADAYHNAIDSHAPYLIEYQLQHKSQGYRWVSERGSVAGTDENGNAILEGFISDITNRKRAEASVANLARFPAEDPSPVLRIAQDGTVLFSNPGGLRLLEFWDTRIGTVLPPAWQSRIQDVLRSACDHTAQLTVGEQTFSLILVPVFPAGYVNIYGMDITARVQNEAKLRQRNAEVEALFSAARAVLLHRDFAVTAKIIFDILKNLIDAKAGYVALLSEDGAENKVLFLDAGGLPCTVDPKLPMPIRGLRQIAYKEHRAVFDNNFWESEWMQFMPKGHVKLSNVMFAPLVIENKAMGLIGLSNKAGGFTDHDALIATAFGEIASIALLNSHTMESLKKSEQTLRDYSLSLEDRVAERTKQLESAQEQLVRREKLAFLGQVAGTIGHELRNPLSVIKNAVYYLNMVYGATDPKMKEMLETIDAEISISNGIIASLLDYARAKPPQRSRIHLGEVIRESAERIIGDGYPAIKVSYDIAADLPFVQADEKQLIQVFNNLISNAVQAMPDGGLLTFSASVDPTAMSVCVAVIDTGTGIAPEQLPRIFEPLFTTKAKGIGLGLPLVRTIIDGHDGTIEVQSKVGSGTTFTICLPLQ